LRRAVLADPRILILDDATTSSVDPSKEHEIRGRASAEVMQGSHHDHHRPTGRPTIALRGIGWGC